MECKARIINTSRGLSGGFTMTLALTGAGLDEIKALEDIDLTMMLKKYSSKRSNDSNAYFHVLVGKIAQVIKRSTNYVKNDMIAQAGFQEYLDDGTPAIIKTNIEPEHMMEQEILHTKVCRVEAQDDGSLTYFYKVYRGSHTYNTKEMQRLIDLTVDEAKTLDIETATPDEVAKMQQLWEAKQNRRNGHET